MNPVVHLAPPAPARRTFARVVHGVGTRPRARSGRAVAFSFMGALVLTAASAGCAKRGVVATSSGRQPPAYAVFVANEASDVISVVGFTPGVGASVRRQIPVGVRPEEIEVPHGLAVSPDGRRWYVSLARGIPGGKVWKMATQADTLLGEADVGPYPEALAVSPDGRFLYATDGGLEGPPVASPISVIYTPTMTEVARVPTCILPEGNSLNAAGTRDYTVCRHSDLLVELDVRSNRVRTRMQLAPGREGRVAASAAASHAQLGVSQPGRTCGPTWVAAGRGAGANRFVYVACRDDSSVLEINVRTWKVMRRIHVTGSPYQLAVSPDGARLVVTLRGTRAVAVIELQGGAAPATVATSESLPHGVAISPDNRYAFVTNEAMGTTPGTLDVIDLQRHERVATTSVRFQPGAVAFWRMNGR